MPAATMHGGLQGKARQIRARGRASRMYTQQWIDEYLEPDEVDERPRKPIPIRSTNEFLPAVFEFDAMGSESTDLERRRVEADANESFGAMTPAAQLEADDVVRLMEIESSAQPISDNCDETLCHPSLKLDTNWSALGQPEPPIPIRIADERTSADKNRAQAQIAEEITPIRVPRRRSLNSCSVASARSKLAPNGSKHPGFWIGCAMGSAAAAVILLALRFAAGAM